MASVLPRRRTDGTVTWRVQFRVDSKMRQLSFEHEQGARQFGALVDRVGGDAALKVWQARQQRTVGVPTLREWVEHYLDPTSGLLTGIEPGTRAGYEAIAKRSFLQVLGDHPVDAITKADVGRWVEWQERQPSGRTKGELVAAKTVKNYHALLSGVLAAAVEAKHRSDNPAFRTRLSAGQRREGVFLSRSDFATLLHFIAPYYRPFVLFLVGSGLRWSEATALTVGDIDTDRAPATARVTKAWKKGNVIGPPKSPRSVRTVSLWPEIVGELALDRPGDEFVFQGALNHGRLWYGSFKARIWDTAVEAANNAERCAAAKLTPIGKRPNPHDLRHTHASWLIAAGTPLAFVQARLGHESITTTIGVYGHLLPEAHEQMASVMQDTMSNVLPAIEA